jgi:hypothetical protein
MNAFDLCIAMFQSFLRPRKFLTGSSLPKMPQAPSRLSPATGETEEGDLSILVAALPR